jgi:hypothetical protein
VIWFRGDDRDYFMYALIIGGAVSYGIASLLIFKIFQEKKQSSAKILIEILIFIGSSLIGELIYFMLNVFLMQASLFIFLLTLLFTSVYVFKRKELPDSI